MAKNRTLILAFFMVLGFTAFAQVPEIQDSDNFLYQNSTTDGAHRWDSIVAKLNRTLNTGTVKTITAPNIFNVTGNNTANVTMTNALAAGYVKSLGVGSGFSVSATVPVTDITGTLPVANGGTGATTLTGYVIGNGTSAFTASPTIPFANTTGGTLQAVSDVGATTTNRLTLTAGYLLGAASEITSTTGTIDGTRLLIPVNLGASNCTVTITGSLPIGIPYIIAFRGSSGGNLKIVGSGSENVNGNAPATGWTITAARAKSIFKLVKVSSTEYVLE